MEPTICPQCNNENREILGVLGNLVHTRCRYCGWEYSHTITDEEKEAMNQPSEPEDEDE